MSDIFGPWTPPGTGGKPPAGDTGDDPGPTTPATLDSEPFWDDDSSGYIQLAEVPPWWRCKLGPYDLPGKVDVTGPGPARKVDIKDAAGKGGATITVKGWSPSDIKITCIIWTPAHLQAWRELEKGLDFTVNNDSKPVDIDSPRLGSRIKSVLIKNIGFLEDGPGGTMKGSIDAVQWIAKPKSTGSGTPKGSSGTSAWGADTPAYVLYNVWAGLYRNGTLPAPTWEDFLAANGFVVPPFPPPPFNYVVPSPAPPPPPPPPPPGIAA